MKNISVVEAIASISKYAGGTGMFMSDICHFLPDALGEPSLLTGTWAGVPDLPIDSRVHVEKVIARRHLFSRSLKPGRQDTIAAFQRIDTEMSIDVVHLHGIWLDFCRDAAIWSRLNERCFVVSPHGMLEPWALNHKKWKKKLAYALYQKQDLQQARAFHACSVQEAESIRNLGFKQPIAVIPNGVQLPDLPTEKLKLNKLETEKKTALFLSRIHPKKGLPMLLNAWKQLAPIDWRLVIAGNDDGGYVPALEALIESLGLLDQVEFVGPLFGEAKEEAYLNADLFVLPSYSENFGIVVTEALGYQVPVLTTTGCPWQELETENCGWWVEPTPEGIEQGLKAALATSDAERREMGQRGRELVENRYLWPAIASNMSVFYHWLLEGGRKPDFVV
jgi:glycosyltransferase involved in cell wall biosynthesis